MGVIITSYEWSSLALPLVAVTLFVIGTYFILRYAAIVPLSLESSISRTALWQLTAALFLVFVLGAASYVFLGVLEESHAARTAAAAAPGVNAAQTAVSLVAPDAAETIEGPTLIEFLSTTAATPQADAAAPSVVSYPNMAYTALTVAFRTFSVMPIVLLGLLITFFFVAMRRAGSALLPEQTAVSGQTAVSNSGAGEMVVAHMARFLLVTVLLLTVGVLLSLSLVVTL